MIEEDNEFVISGPEPLEPVPNISLGQLVYDSLLINPNNHAALVDAITEKSIFYKELLIKSCSLAEALLRCGYGRNTVITVCSENSIHFFTPVISALYIGAITAPINHNYTETELIHFVNIYKAKVIFCSKKVYNKIIQLRSKLSFIERILIIDGDDISSDVDGLETLDNFIYRNLLGYHLVSKFQPTRLDASNQVAFIMSSSGTTGLPKGVMVTHTNAVTRYMQAIDPRYEFQFKDACYLGLLPFFHAYGLITSLIALIKSEKIVVMSRFDEDLFLKSIQNNKIYTLWLAPPLVVFLAKSPLMDKYNLSNLKEIICAAAPLSKSIEESVKKRLKIKCRQTYGLTETLAVTAIPVSEERSGSSGKVISYMTCKVRDLETGKSLGPRQTGELCFKGPLIMKGYYNNEEATRNCFTPDGWLLTGDLGYYDEEKYFYIVDRLKEVIKYKGFQVAPAELEAILLTHPKIRDAGVVGIPNEEAGELPLAFVVKNLDARLTEREVEDYVAERLSPQKKLRGGVIFISEIPKNPSGKILRRELRKMLKQHASKL